MVGEFWTWLTTGNHASAVGAVIAGVGALVGLVGWLMRRSTHGASGVWASVAVVAALAATAAFFGAWTTPSVTATRGGVAIGGNVSGSTIEGGRP